MAEYQKIGGVWKPVTPSIKVAGTWRSCVKHLNVGGAWKSMAASRLWVPTDAGTDLTAWFDFTDTPPNTAGVLTNTATITNKRGGGFDLTIVNDSSALTYSNNGVSIPNGSFGYMQWASLPSKYLDLAFVGTANAPGSWRSLLVRPGGIFHYIILQESATALGSYSNAFWGTGLTWAGGNLKQLYYTMPTDTGVAMSLDGGTMSPATGVNQSDTNTNLTLMNYSGGGQGFGTANELIIFTVGQTANREKAQGYLAHKWDAILGVTTLVGNLPSGHTYKSAPPMVAI